MNLFLTGANGYIGRNFVKKASKNHKIFAVTRKKKNKRIKNVKWLIGPIDKNWKFLKKADVLIHLATVGAYNKKSKFDEKFEFNVKRSSNLLINAIKANCKKWLIISTNKEKKISKLVNRKMIKNTHSNEPHSNEPHFNYALTKFIFSKICKDLSTIFNVKCRIIKLFHVYGNDEPKNRLWPLLNHYSKNNKNLKMSSGLQTYDFNHIDDVIDGLIKTLDFRKNTKRKFPQEWDLASGKSMSVKLFAKRIWKKNNGKSKILFSQIKNFDSDNYLANKKQLWKINYRNP